MSEPKPTRCIDPVIKFCQECRWGYVIYPDDVETREDLEGCTFESGCTLGFDKGRPEDEPTEAELKEFEEWCKKCQAENELRDNAREAHIDESKLPFD